MCHLPTLTCTRTPRPRVTLTEKNKAGGPIPDLKTHCAAVVAGTAGVSDRTGKAVTGTEQRAQGLDPREQSDCPVTRRRQRSGAETVFLTNAC